MLTDCSSFQGSTTSSSTLSDVMTLTTGTTSSSWCAIGAGTRIRVLRLVRPHLRRLLVAPDLNPSYGFAVRGGKEFGTGFFVSNVERNSEADLKGLRVGDQILRINGFRVDDAVHKEFIQFVTSQDRVTLKVRGVGMLPIKDNIGERLSWHVVSAGCLSLSGGSSGSSSGSSITPTSASSTLSKSHHHHRSHQSLATSISNDCSAYKSSPPPACSATLDSRHSLAGHSGKDMTVVLNVAPRTKLGLGICKGPEWKPGIFVQFTKDKSVAREAGLRQGDQILSVNSIDFSDVLFSEAVAVMKGSNKLEMLVRSGAGCDLFPGESSGYNSSASSVTGDQSPCWADPKSKRLTSVREEPRHDEPGPQGRVKEVNKTIIKLSENGTSINNTFIEEPRPPVQATKLPDVCFVGRGGGHGAEGATKQVKIVPSSGQRPSTKEHNYGILKMCPAPVSNGGAALPPKPPPPQLPSADAGRGVAAAAPAAGSSLTSAIEEELRKRREKQQQHPSQSINDNGGGGIIGNRLANSQVSGKDRIGNSAAAVAGPGSPTAATSSSRCNRSAPHISDQHNALMDEFKRAHQRMFKNGFHENEQREQQERQEALKRTTIMADEVNHRNSVVPPPQASTAFSKSSGEKSTNGLQQTAQHHSPSASSIPPPPPQFANSPPKSTKVTNGTASPTSTASTPRNRPPSSPVPDYDNVQFRNHGQPSPDTSNSSYGTRRTLRLGTVTIGEYERPRKEPGKFDFIGSPPPPPQPQSQQPQQQQQRMTTNGTSKSSLHSELQHTLTRSNLRKTNMPQEHQSHCPNVQHQQQYSQRQSMSTLNRLTGNGKSPEKTPGSTNTAVRNGGILKNGGSSASSSSLYATAATKHTEKSISFGN